MSRLLDEDLYPRRVNRTPEQVKSDDKFIAKLLQEIGLDTERKAAGTK